MRRLTLKQLQTVRAVAQSGTIATAADQLKVTPAALTARIKLLESDVGLAFFDRGGGRLRLTDAGQEVVNTTVRMEMLLVELGNTLAALKGKHTGRISSRRSFRRPNISRPKLIAAFSRDNPRIELSLSRRQSPGDDHAAARLCRRHRPDGPAADGFSGDQSSRSASIPQVVVAPLDHPMVGKPRHREGGTRQREFHRARGRLGYAQRLRFLFRRRRDEASRTSSSRWGRTRRSSRR